MRQTRWADEHRNGVVRDRSGGLPAATKCAIDKRSLAIMTEVMLALQRWLREWTDKLAVATGVGLAPEVGGDGSEDRSGAVTVVDELRKLESNTSFVPPFPLKHIAIRHPGRMTANGLGSMEIGHADH